MPPRNYEEHYIKGGVVKKLKYQGEGIKCQEGEFKDGDTVEVSDEAAIFLLTVAGFSEVKTKKKTEVEI